MVPRSISPYPNEAIRSDMDRLLAGLFSDWGERWPWGFESFRAFPAVNLWEDDRNFYAEAEIPGMKLSDIEVSIVGDELTLKGQRKAEDLEDSVYHRRERGVGSFARVLSLPARVEADQVKAALKDGVLTITLPKAREAQPRRIEVKVLDHK